MTLEFSREEFDYYAVTVQLKDEWYSIILNLPGTGKIYFYDRVGMTTQMRHAFLWYRIFHARLGKGSGHVPDSGGPVLQWRQRERRGRSGILLYSNHDKPGGKLNQYPANFDVAKFYGGI